MRKAQAEERIANMFPLARFAPEKRQEIERLVAQERPPAKWLDLGLAQIISRAWVEWYLARGRNPFLNTERQSIPQDLRRLVIERDGYVCQICGGDVEAGDIHLDHYIPLSKGGPTTLENLRVAHSRCNIAKRDKMPEEVAV